jgi:dolichyl-phosphate beta-glucosyltransferase
MIFMSKIFLSVVIPCYDEMANLQKGVLDKVAHFLDKKNISYEIIIVDDGSKDGSKQFLKEFVKEYDRFSVLDGNHYGKAGAVTKGMLKAKGEYVLFTDMDQATPIEEIDNLLPFFKQGYDVVIGSRNTVRKGSPLSRQIISRAAIILRKVIVGLPHITDTQCGFKMFTQEATQKLFNKIDEVHGGFQEIKGSNVTSGFDVELLYLAMKQNYKIKEVPVSWLYVETRRVNPINDSIEGVLDLLRIKRNTLKGKYRNL